ncbi:cysteine hydrolase family protein [Promicromonospora sukumoe]|uniref:Nicotinamidase-related amidase n=1 Tax=Promicromonospora sukumoe TaxID=88382 RepID=A0A7W3PD81_9MICO|nr:cysteine hydrolase [Promicromonospora sukumoe]MBA8807690.1 nicotinamidase-related amidase [Promicromonospora sukumoe]
MNTSDPSLGLRRTALVTIDVQRDTLDGAPLEIPGTSAAVPTICDLAAAFRTAGQPIVHVVRLYRADGTNAEPVRRALVSGPTPLLRPGTPGRLLAPGLVPHDPDLDDDELLAGHAQQVGDREIILYKPRWGAFFATDLDQRLRRDEVETIVFAGANFPNCPRTSIYQASERDYQIVVADDGISGLDGQGRAQLSGIGVELAPTEQIIDRIRLEAGAHA